MVKISTGGNPREKQGFKLVGMEEINRNDLMTGGNINYINIMGCLEGEYKDLLSIAIWASQVPNAVPDLFIRSFTPSGWKRGDLKAFVQGEDTQTFDFNFAKKKIGIRKLAVSDQKLGIFLTAHAVNDTTFYTRGLLGVYRLVT